MENEVISQQQKIDVKSSLHGIIFKFWSDIKSRDHQMSAITTAENFSSYETNKNPLLEVHTDETKCQSYKLESFSMAHDGVESDDTPNSAYSTEDSIFTHNSSEDILYTTPAPRINARVPLLQSIMNALFMMYHN
jgi:hypothetical protein